jgi:hypothetical protein
MIKKLDIKTLLKKMGILHFLGYTFLMLVSLVPWLCHGMPHRVRSYAKPGNKWQSVGAAFQLRITGSRQESRTHLLTY